MREVRQIETIIGHIDKNYDQEKFAEASAEIEKAMAICPDLTFLKIKQVDCLAKTGNAAKVILVDYHVKAYID